MGWMDEDGYLFLGDRSADMILAGGANIYPAEIEAALDAHPAVGSSCVIGLPDEDLGNRIHAIVQADGAGHRRRAPRAPRRPPRRATRSRARSSTSTEPLRDDAGKMRRGKLRAERMPIGGSPDTSAFAPELPITVENAVVEGFREPWVDHVHEHREDEAGRWPWWRRSRSPASPPPARWSSGGGSERRPSRTRRRPPRPSPPTTRPRRPPRPRPRRSPADGPDDHDDGARSRPRPAAGAAVRDPRRSAVSRVAHETPPGPGHGAAVSAAAHDHTGECGTDDGRRRRAAAPGRTDGGRRRVRRRRRARTRGRGAGRRRRARSRRWQRWRPRAR